MAFLLFFAGEAHLFSWCLLHTRGITITLELFFDLESVLFFSAISWIASAVFYYSQRYIGAEKFLDRFTFLLFRFVLSIFIMVFSPNLFRVIIGWDGLGITSFLLVIYFQNKSSMNAGLITVLTNRLGDVLILRAIAVNLRASHWDHTIENLAGASSNNMIFILLMIIAAFTKRAQIPFSSWLPAAMAAPTPVSSLVHSSTLVTAGVYLLLRFQNVLLITGLSQICLLFGCLTICLAGIGGLFETDFKKMVALSTLRQLGLIVSSLGIGLWQVAFFHLLTHAFFKALLFITTGSRIHSAADYQDLRLISLPWEQRARTTRIALVANISLIGMPFLAGFYSKDLILEILFSASLSVYYYFLFVLGTILTVLYSIRFLMASSFGGLKKIALVHKTEDDVIIFHGYDQLFGLAVFRGALLNWFYLHWASNLLLTLETKNLVLLIILRCLGYSFINKIALATINNTWALKWRLGSIWALHFLAKSYNKLNFLSLVLKWESLLEKFFFPQFLFDQTRASFRQTRKLPLQTSLLRFYLGLASFAILLFLICFEIELFISSFGLDFGSFASKLSQSLF